MSKQARHILVVGTDGDTAVYLDGVKRGELTEYSSLEAFQDLNQLLEKEGSQGAPIHIDTAYTSEYTYFEDLPTLIQNVKGLVRD